MGILKAIKALDNIFIKKLSTKANPEKKVDFLVYKDQANPIPKKFKRAGQRKVAKQYMKDLLTSEKTKIGTAAGAGVVVGSSSKKPKNKTRGQLKKAKKFNGGFMTKGQGAAIRGTKFKGTF